MTTSTNRHHPPLAAIIVAPLLAVLVLVLFAWPSARLAPRDLPVGVAGAPAAVQAVERGLRADDGAFDIHRYATEAAARDAIEDREVYGALVATPAGGKLLTASGASPIVAQQLSQVASARGGAVVVEDVAPASPAGAGLPSSVLPLVLAGILVGIVAAALAAGAWRRAALVLVGSVVAALGATAVIDGWLGIVGGDWLANAAVLTLLVGSIAMVVAGFERLLGRAGVALAALTMVFVGNPFSGAGSAPELLPEPAGWLGQLLPPGAGANLLRSTGFFDGAGASEHVVVLLAWTLVGLAALGLAGYRSTRASASPVSAPLAV